MKKKLLVVMAMLALALALTTSVASASNGPHSGHGGNSQLAGVYAIATLGPGLAGGGSLQADGGVTGGIIYNDPNSDLVALLKPVSWSPIPDGSGNVVAVYVCIHVTALHGTDVFAYLPTPDQFCEPVPVTGHPVILQSNTGGQLAQLAPGEKILLYVKLFNN